VDTPLQVLKRYWKHTAFRPLQEDIINGVLNGKDTLALLPTGGGKSVCFQVPALIRDGLCVVITPLIALMKDQVEQLQRKGILAVAIHTGMSRRQIDVLLDNCVYGPVKFLYVSPERIQTELFIERFKKMNVNLLAVDEAHCVSQWGFDFRPPYLQIHTLRTWKPVPVIALTSTATKKVCDDIVTHLHFKKDHAIFQKTFARPNLSLVVRKTDNKEQQLASILKKINGPGLVYVRSRRSTEQIANFIIRQGHTATFYHAGLDADTRTKHQDTWIKNKVRVMVATNAFGMGIDKPDVRFVAHIDIPETIEAYYQEAGRAGRDGQRSYAVVIYQDADVTTLEQRVEQANPDIDFLRLVYQALANFYQLAEGSAEGESFDFDLSAFCDRFQLHPAEVYSALKKLEEQAIIQFNESFYSPSLLHIAVDQSKLYEFQVANSGYDAFIKMILRLFGGEIFSGFVKISESYLAKAVNLSIDQTKQILQQLHQWNVVVYQPVKDSPQITFLTPRVDAKKLPVNQKKLEERKKLMYEQMQAVREYVVSDHRCRMQILLDYFGEENYETCGHCDVCISKRKQENDIEIRELKKEIFNVIKKKPATIEQVEEIIEPVNVKLYLDAVRELLDEEILEYDAAWKLIVKRKRPLAK